MTQHSSTQEGIGISPASSNFSVQCMLVVALAFIYGPIATMNVFTIPVEKYAEDALQDMWAPSVALSFILATPVMAYGGTRLSSCNSRGPELRKMTLACGISTAMMMISAYGVFISNATLVIVSVACLCVPIALVPIIVNELVTLWAPRHMGFAVGVYRVFVNVSLISSGYYFRALLNIYSVPVALILSSMSVVVICLAVAALLRSPDENDTQLSAYKNIKSNDNEAALTFRDVLVRMDFWRLFLAVASCDASFTIIPYFFKIGDIHGAPQVSVLRFFQAGFICAMVLMPVSTTLCDVARTNSGPFQCGSRNVLLFVTAVQTAALFLLYWFDEAGRFDLWAVLADIVRICYQLFISICPLLVADFFGKKNVALVYGTAVGLGFGISEAIGTVLMLIVERQSQVPGTPQQYTPFYLITAAWSFVAILILFSLRRIPGKVKVTPKV